MEKADTKIGRLTLSDDERKIAILGQCLTNHSIREHDDGPFSAIKSWSNAFEVFESPISGGGPADSSLARRMGLRV